MPEEQDNMVIGTIGSGLSYAAPLHDRYQYIMRGYEREQHKLPEKLQKHARIEGLR